MDDVITDDLIEKILEKDPLNKKQKVRWKTYISIPFEPTEDRAIVAELFVEDKPVGSVRCRKTEEYSRVWSAWVWGSKLAPKGLPRQKLNQLDILIIMMRRVEKVVIG